MATDPQNRTLRGTVTRLFHSSPTFCAGRLLPAQGQTARGSEISFAGKVFVREGEVVALAGRWEEHEKYGRQFRAESRLYEEGLDAAGLACWLSHHGSAAGIGPMKAQRIAADLGENFAGVLRDDPEQIAIEYRLKLEDVKALASAWAEREEENAVGTRLAAFGLTHSEVHALYERFKGAVVSLLEADPYAVLGHVPGMGFKKADAIAMKLGTSETSPGRLKAAVVYALGKAADKGSTCAERRALIDETVELIELGRPDAVTLVTGAVDDLIAEKRQVRQVRSDGSGEVFLALRRYWGYELAVAAFFDESSGPNPHFPPEVATAGAVLAACPNLDDSQVEAVALALGRRLCLITGGAGSGKSTVIAALADFYRRHELRVRLAAPTGKAARRLEEVTAGAFEATTIHRLLAYSAKNGGFQHHAGNPVTGDVVIVDECFPGRTPVDTPCGPRNIQDLLPGDRIVNAAGVDTIVAVKKTEVSRVVKLQAGGKTLFCSPHHRWFSSRGVVFASDLEPGDSLLQTAPTLRLLRGDDHATQREVRTYAVLRLLLFGDVVDAVPRACGQTAHAGGASQAGQEEASMAAIRATGGGGTTGTHQGLEPNGQSVGPGEDFRLAPSARTPPACPGWQRARPHRDRGIAPGSPRRRLGSPCRSSGPDTGVPDPLQTGPCLPGPHACYRTGRVLSRLPEAEGAGQAEDGETHLARVDRVEVLEQGDPELDQFRDASGKLYFYDLQASRHPSFSVKGLLTHNCSMIDSELACHLLSAVGSKTAVVLVGDPNQLPPVGPGAILRDALAHKIAPAAELARCHRQAGPLKQNCAAVLAGEVGRTILNPDGSFGPWVVHRKLYRPDDVIAAVEKLFAESLAGRFAFDPAREVQCLSPRHDGPLGTKAVNALLQRLHQKSLGVTVPPAEPDARLLLRVGDRVIQTRNNYDLDVMNGHQGIVLRTDPLVVDFDGRTVAVPNDCKGDVELAYCLTPHKCQGSEFPCVVVVCHSSHRFMLHRNWIYTAVTRAKKVCVVLGDDDGVRHAVETVRTNDRATMLPLLAGGRHEFAG